MNYDDVPDFGGEPIDHIPDEAGNEPIDFAPEHGDDYILDFYFSMHEVFDKVEEQMDAEPDPMEIPSQRPQHYSKGRSDYKGSGKPDTSGFFNNNSREQKYNYRHPSKQAAQKTKEGLASVGLSYDHVGDIAEDYDFLFTDGGLEVVELKNDIKKMIKNRGPEHAQAVADRMHGENRLSDTAYDTISRLVRMHEVGEDYERNQESDKSEKTRRKSH